ncbi:serine/threonine protein kinase [Kitasatospora sp. SolWspMP-SS2h]|uniref:serine/threonine-protein kinase n=1 Tax=Kitasatospora sp. SolWspMP-SS2h TaxID=1305729 RepID=UPI000DBF4175|nr:serine/threonine-protein kinase [Kitasatospora sp. SolWspMP-SS2h]RAJ41773.1 serine/threonine protein kinase [Kitasatospora sp. SolWspMP-SS2h]
METLGAGDPHTVGPYRLLGRLGAGGMGEVFLGRTAGGRTVAVKTVRQEFAGDREFRQRFRQEVAAARRVGGRWTAPVLDADTEGPQPWVATGYVAGPSLSDAVRQFGPLPTATVRALGTGLADALAAVHELGLLHRDVKPSNVLLALDGPRLIDFGISRALDATSALTRSGYVVGSPGFMSPEQARGRPSGPAGDVFGLGAVLAFAATGRAPFGEQDSAAGLLYRIVHEEPELDGLDGELLELVRNCLDKDPERRPTPAAVRERLVRSAAGQTGLGDRGWLPGAVSEEVARMAVALLDLESRPLPPPTVLAAPPTPAAPPTAPYRAATAPYPASPGFGPPPPGYPAAAPTPPGQYPYPHPHTPAPHPAPQPPAKRRAAPLVATGVVAAVLAGLGVWAATAGTGGSDAAAGGPSGSPAVTGSTSARPTGTVTPAGHDSKKAEPAPSPSSSPSPSASPAPSPPDDGDAVADAFLGVFEGPISASGNGPRLVIRITVHQGAVGDTIAFVESDGGLGTNQVVCTNEAALVSATRTRLVARSLPETVSAGCTPLAGDGVLTPNKDGSLRFVQQGFTGDLARHS